MRIPFLLSLAALAACALAVPGGAQKKTPPAPDFARDIRPLLGDHCLACHGFDEKKRQADLRLDTPISPARAREVLRRLALPEGAPGQMPPPGAVKPLAPAQRALLQTWARAGAPVKPHWAFVAPQRPALPKVKNAAWVRNPIDTFILAKLEQERIAPSPEADRRTLIRRVSLDLTGIPPTPAEVDAFLADTKPGAYERVVDRLLASPRYGEKMAQAWLDGARYADSNGYQADYERFQWPWRDWVIDAFNRNMPFDQFTVEQLAGDLLPNATLSQKIATGFNRNHRINTEGGVIPEEWRVENVVDRLETTGAVWLALSIGCGRCHDHKYDPLTQRDFYSLFAYFNNVSETGTGAERPVNHPPVVRAPRPEDDARVRAAAAALTAAQKDADTADRGLAERLAAWEARGGAAVPGVAWTSPAPTATAKNGTRLSVLPDGVVRGDGPNPATETYTVELPAAGDLSGVRLEVFPEDGKLARSVNGNFVLTKIDVLVDGKAAPLGKASADFAQDGFPAQSATDDSLAAGWGVYGQTDRPHAAVFALAAPARSARSVTVRLACEGPYGQHQFTRFRVSLTDAADPHAASAPTEAVEALKVAASARTDAQKRALAAWFRTRDPESLAAERRIAEAKKARDDAEASIPTVMVMDEMPAPRDCFVLIRGQYDQRGEKVGPGIPPALGNLPPGAPNNRLGFARWIASPRNPLTARVAVNRLWEKFFGVGIVATSEDFGVRADLPSHPDLLDWLATEFVRLRWDMKAIQRTLVTSAAYRQASAVRPELARRDPENRLVARSVRLRLPAEVIRDQALAASGLLVEKVGGPGVRPYQPDGVWDEINVYGNLRNYKHDTGPNLYRRSLYTFWKRTAAPPQMAVFDVPGREACRVRRSRTNTPLQALILMNDPTYVEAARALAERAMGAGATPLERLDILFRRALGRRPTLAESWILEEGVVRRLAAFRARPGDARQLLSVGDRPADPKRDPAELAAWTLTASIVLNTDEMITRE